mmetsp:Transcript_21731/g.37406  ORF Transcript_21731/g.37406 Transcript_21731/m.37406 type:complete len:246 (+) Transcript_21731:596-1333(+)
MSFISKLARLSPGRSYSSPLNVRLTRSCTAATLNRLSRPRVRVGLVFEGSLLSLGCSCWGWNFRSAFSALPKFPRPNISVISDFKLDGSLGINEEEIDSRGRSRSDSCATLFLVCSHVFVVSSDRREVGRESGRNRMPTKLAIVSSTDCESPATEDSALGAPVVNADEADPDSVVAACLLTVSCAFCHASSNLSVFETFFRCPNDWPLSAFPTRVFHLVDDSASFAESLGRCFLMPCGVPLVIGL